MVYKCHADGATIHSLRRLSAREIPASRSVPAACAIRLFAWIFVDDDEYLLMKGATMSHTRFSPHEFIQSDDDRQQILAFIHDNGRAVDRLLDVPQSRSRKACLHRDNSAVTAKPSRRYGRTGACLQSSGWIGPCNQGKLRTIL